MAQRPQQAWTIDGAAGEPIRGDAHTSQAPPRAVALLAHGFKGYKDYGFIPVLAGMIAGAMPIVVHRFNFSHSGVGDDPATFGRPDLFERDTWSKQVHDVGAVLDAAGDGMLPETPAGLPVILIGHSRGGVSCLLAAGRRSRDGVRPLPDAVVTIAAPAQTAGLNEADLEHIHRHGYAETKSSRTGQTLRIGADWLREQQEFPADHNLQALCAHIRAPVLAIHGVEDPTVPPAAAGEIASACPLGRSILIDGANHVFNTPNPADPNAEPSAPLAALRDAALGFLAETLSLG